MLLIWGWRAFTRTLREGIFYSPAAGRDAPYRLVQVRRWFTFFFVPIIPLRVLGTYVECQLTKATYDPRVLDNPTNIEFQDHLATAVREVVAAVALADGAVTDDERRLALRIVGEYVVGYDDAAFTADLARSGTAPLDARLAFLAGSLNEHGKERLLAAAARVKSADGQLDHRDSDALAWIGQSLSMSPAHVRGVIHTVMSPAE